MAIRRFPSRYEGVCRVCQREIKVGDPIVWDSKLLHSRARHETCPAKDPVETPKFDLATWEPESGWRH